MLSTRQTSRISSICVGRIAGSSSRLGLRQKSTSNAPCQSEVDSVIPKKPTWSVHELLSSYPRPTISSATLKKLHELSALIPPQEGSIQHEQIKAELEEMVRLVEAVKLVDTSGVGDDTQTVPDGRIWPEGEGMALSDNAKDVEFDDVEEGSGTQLLKHAARTKDGFYIVESDRRKK